MAGDVDKGTIGLASGEFVFVGPNLRLDIVNVDCLAERNCLRRPFLGVLVATSFGIDRFGCVGGSKDFDLGGYIHVVVDLVFEIEVGNVLGYRIRNIGEIEAHWCFKELCGPVTPGPANDALVPGGIARDCTSVNDYEPAAAPQKGVQIIALLSFDIARFLGVENEDICFCELCTRREF